MCAYTFVDFYQLYLKNADKIQKLFAHTAEKL